MDSVHGAGRPYRVLLLGEGDFSFTRGLVNGIIQYHKCQGSSKSITASGVPLAPQQLLPMEMISTSYDGLDDLMSKYPSFPSIRQSAYKQISNNGLSDLLSLTYFHGVDATKSIHSQLLANNHSDNVVKLNVFDTIIFNFPHLGYESIPSHSSLIAHIFNSVHCVLSDRDNSDNPSVFILSLTTTQFDLWNVEQHGIRNGFSLMRSYPMIPAVYEGYEMKRHQVGKTFRRRVDSFGCYHYVFIKSGQIIGMTCALTVNSVSNSTAAMDICWLLREFYLSSRVSTNSCDEETGTKRTCDAAVMTTNNERKKKEKKSHTLERLADGHYREVLVGTPSTNAVTETNNLVLMWECQICSKQYASLQGIRTHYYTAHVLNTIRETAESNNDISTVRASAIADASFQCSVCLKVLANAEGLANHMLVKHSSDSSSVITRKTFHNPSEEMKSEATAKTALSSFECHICGILFEDERSLERHRNEGIIPFMLSGKDAESKEGIVIDSTVHNEATRGHVCQLCMKTFKDDRAISQHFIFCKQKYEK